MTSRFSGLLLLMALAVSRLAAEEPLPTPPPGLEPGLIVYLVELDSPAAKAGVQVGDVLLNYDGAPLLFVSALTEAREKAEAAKKETAAVELRRGEETQTVTVPPGKLGVSVRPPLPPAAQALWEAGQDLPSDAYAEKAEKWQVAAEAAQQVGDARAVAWLWLQSGSQWDTAQSFDRAAAAYALAAERSQAVRDTRGAGDRLINQGVAAYNFGNLADARESFEQALAIYERLVPDSLKVADSLNNLGAVALDQGDLVGAKAYLQRALAIQERLAPDSLDVAASLANLGNMALHQGNLAEAQEYYRRALGIYERLAPDSLEVAATLNNLGLMTFHQGNLTQAQEILQRASTIRERLAPNGPDVAGSLINLGNVVFQQGNLNRAYDCYQRALAIYERLAPDSIVSATSLHNLGTVAIQQGNLSEAKVYLQRALAIKDRLAPDSLVVAESLNNLGCVCYQQGDLTEAREYYQQALAIKERLAPDSLDMANSLNNLGLLAYDQGDLTGAKECHQQALSIRERLAPDSLEMAGSLSNMGDVIHRQGDSVVARDYHQKALSLGRQYGGREVILLSAWGLAQDLAALDKTEEALQHYALVLDTIEEWRIHAAGEAEQSATFLGRYASPVIEYAALLLRENRPDEALHVAERGKGRVLLDVLAAGRTPLLERDLTEEERQGYAQREQSFRRLNREVLQSQQENDETRRKELLPLRDEAQFQLTNYEQRLYALHPGLQSQVGDGKLLTADAARALPLPPDTLVLSYLIGEKQTLLFALRRPNPNKPGELAVHVLDVEAEALNDDVASLRASLLPQTATGEASQVGFYTRRARKVGETLLKPVQKWLKKAKHLIVCSDQSLYDLPFGALIAPGQKEPLLTTHAVSLAPSVTVLGEWLKAVPKAAEPPRLLALGNPALPPPAKPEETGEVKIASARQLIDWGGGWRGEFRRTPEGDLVALPFAAEEVQELAGLYGERATVQVGEKA
jgi:tetratricopeptide (TPR) repeat protein